MEKILQKSKQIYLSVLFRSGSKPILNLSIDSFKISVIPLAVILLRRVFLSCFVNIARSGGSVESFCATVKPNAKGRKNISPLLFGAVFFLFVMLTCLNLLKAQNAEPSRFQIFAPNTYELARYGDVPVDLSTGVPKINVPLMNFSDKNINLDISLSYNASGIKVDQEATWVGLGWTLNIGGVITRELRGLPDGYRLAPNGYNFNSRTSIPDYYGSSSPSDYFDQVNSTLRVATSSNGTDNEADVFYYNFNGRSGKFFMDENANAVLTKYEDIKVQMIHGNSSSYDNFVVTDEKGVKYEFAATEGTTNYTGSPISYISAWYLSRITSPSGGEIVIEYVPGGLTSPSYQKRCYSQAYFPLSSVVHAIPYEYTRTCVNSGSSITSIIPKKIISSSGNYVELITSDSPRLDCQAYLFNQLNYIILYDSNQNQIKKLKFNYSYFEANNRDKFPVEGSSDPRSLLNYRLRLDSCQELSTIGNSNNKYRFEYFGDNNPQTDDPYTLPYRLSPSQDHWGYYNNTQNQSIFPSNPSDLPFTKDPWMLALAVFDYTGVSSNFTYSVYNGGNREPDTEAVKACALRKIIYPSGGYTQFTFEPHELSTATQNLMAGGLKVKQIESYDGIGSPKVKNYEYSNSSVSCEKCLSTTGSFYYTWYSQFVDPNTSAPGYPEFMSAFGIPSELVSSRHVVKVEASSQLMLGSGTEAFYNTVKESSPGNGFTIYDYSYDADIMHSWGDMIDGLPTPGNDFLTFVDTAPSGGFNPFIHTIDKSYCTFPFPYFLNNDWRRGHLLSKSVYSESGGLLSQDSIEYDIKGLKVIPGYKVSQITEYKFIYARYYDIGGMAKPVKQVSRTYSSDGSYVRSVKEFDYTSPDHKQITQTRDYTSKGEAVFTKYYYPTEYETTLSYLTDRHILLPVDVRNYRNGKLISGEQIQYGSNGLPLTVYRAETGDTITDIPFNPQLPYSFVPKLTNTYYADNSLQSQTITDGTPSLYLWSYKGQHPVALIGNATYGELKTALDDASETFINDLREKTEPSLSDFAVLNGLRDSPLLKKSLITTYRYRPLVGMTRQTDIRGQSLNYEYDGFQHLRIIKDHNGDILKSYEFHYKP